MTSSTRALAIVVIGLVVFPPSALPAQDPAADSLRVRGLSPGGLRAFVTESWGTLAFTISNQGDRDRDVRLLVFFPARPDVQFGRDVWVPADASVTTWLPFGPALRQPGRMGREIEYLLYDRSDGQERLILPPGEQRVRTHAVVYRKRESTTAILVDETAQGDKAGILTYPDSKPAQALFFAQALRDAGGFPERISFVPGGFLPGTAAAYDGIDIFILAGNRIAADPIGQESLRHWLEQGGRLWVMLDLVAPETVAPIVGGNLDIQVVDRVSLTSVQIQPRKAKARIPPRATSRIRSSSFGF